MLKKKFKILIGKRILVDLSNSIEQGEEKNKIFKMAAEIQTGFNWNKMSIQFNVSESF